MTNEEAIDNLRYLISEDCTDSSRDYVEEIEMAIEALEKQIPMKPNDIRRLAYNSMRIGLCECGDGLNECMRYCSTCGRKITWSES